mgnify:FL=1
MAVGSEMEATPLNIRAEGDSSSTLSAYSRPALIKLRSRSRNFAPGPLVGEGATRSSSPVPRFLASRRRARCSRLRRAAYPISASSRLVA